MTPPRVIGLGSYHGDDRAGWLIVDRLYELGYPSAQLRKAAHPADLLDDLSFAAPILICDACQGSGDAGATRRWQWPTDALQDLRTGGTHDMPLHQVLALAEHFADRRLHVEVWGVTGTNWSPAAPPSPAVYKAACDVAARIWRDSRA